MKTTDFLLATVLVFAVTLLMGALTTALTMAEVLQYVSFAGARSYFAADLTADQDQVGAAENKVRTLLTKTPFLTPAIAGEWIRITRKGAANYSAYRDSIGASANRNQFVGYQIEFSAPILNINLPLLGTLVSPPGGGDQFNSTVSSFLMREPSFMECQQYLRGAYQVLLGKDSKYQGAPASGGATTAMPALDNGC